MELTADYGAGEELTPSKLEAMDPLLRIESPEGHIVCDSRYWPVVIATWAGENDVAAVYRFFEWHDWVIERGRNEGGYLIITDADRASRPSPVVRRLVAKLSDDLPEDSHAVTLANYVVLTNPLLRGALTAIQWTTRQRWTSVQLPSMHAAFARARLDLERAGIGVPENLEGALRSSA